MAAYPSLDVVLRVVEAIATVAACILVIWYAWETREIRKATKEQSDVMRRQLEMLQQKEQPWFTCNQTEKSDSMVKLHLLNSGGRALSCKVSSQDQCNPRLAAKNSVAPGQRLEIEIRNLPNPRPAQVMVKLEYIDINGQENAVDLIYNSESGRAEVVQTTKSESI